MQLNADLRRKKANLRKPALGRREAHHLPWPPRGVAIAIDTASIKSASEPLSACRTCLRPFLLFVRGGPERKGECGPPVSLAVGAPRIGTCTIVATKEKTKEIVWKSAHYELSYMYAVDREA